MRSIQYTFPKFSRLRFRSQYQRVARDHKRHVGHWIIVDVRPNGLKNSRLGITATRQFGDAHDRNRFKRLVREAFRLCQHQLSSIDLVVRPRSISKGAIMDDILQELKLMLYL